MFLAVAVARFQLRYPVIEIDLRADDRLVEATTTELDLLVRVTRLRDGDFVAKRLATDRLVVAGAPSYFEKKPRPARAEDLAQHDCLHYSLVDPAAEWRFRGGDDGGSLPTGRRVFSTTDGTVLREAMLAGLGLAVLPFFMVARDVAAGRAELVLEGARRAEIGVFAVMPSVRGLPRRVRALVEHLQRHFAREDWRGVEGKARTRGSSRRQRSRILLP
jgi:DNA-binding transcriptional LysR family regulator